MSLKGTEFRSLMLTNPVVSTKFGELQLSYLQPAVDDVIAYAAANNDKIKDESPICLTSDSCIDLVPFAMPLEEFEMQVSSGKDCWS